MLANVTRDPTILTEAVWPLAYTLPSVALCKIAKLSRFACCPVRLANPETYHFFRPGGQRLPRGGADGDAE